ncbi:MAG: ABC transporter ATP-binding protein [Acetobacteraceae bacterium]
MSRIRFEGVSKSYRGAKALDGIDLEIEPSSLSVLYGPPGCGKSVLMRILIGLEAPTSGRILFDGEDITGWPAADRSIGYVPQSFALFPHMSVADNIGYPLALQRVPRQEIARRVDQVARMLGVRPLLAKRPTQLSGGEKQRAAIARGILKNAEIFILDDPLVGLDFKLRESLMEDLKDMRAELGATFLYLTADPIESLAMAEQLVVIDQGRVVEAGAVDGIYYDPVHLRTAELVGFPRCNILPGEVDQAARICNSAIGRLGMAFENDGVASEVMLAIRPEDIAPVHSGRVPFGIGTITLFEHLGSESVVYFRAGETTLVTTIPASDAAPIEPGDDFPFMIRPGGPLVFDRATGRRVGRIGEAPHG